MNKKFGCLLLISFAAVFAPYVQAEDLESPEEAVVDSSAVEYDLVADNYLNERILARKKLKQKKRKEGKKEQKISRATQRNYRRMERQLSKLEEGLKPPQVPVEGN